MERVTGTATVPVHPFVAVIVNLVSCGAVIFTLLTTFLSSRAQTDPSPVSGAPVVGSFITRRRQRPSDCLYRRNVSNVVEAFTPSSTKVFVYALTVLNLEPSRRAPRLEDSLLENARSSIPLPVPRPVWVNPTNGNETLQLLYQSAYGAGRCQSRVVLLKMRLTMRVVRMEILYAKVTWYAALPPWTFRWSLSSVRRQNVGTFRGNPYSCCETDTSSELKS